MSLLWAGVRRWGRTLIVSLLVGPAASLIAARLLALSIGSLRLDQALPVGTHSYLPAATQLSQSQLVVLAAAGTSLAALVTLLARRRHESANASEGRSVMRWAICLALSQLALFSLQVGLAGGTDYVSDSLPTVLLASLLAVLCGTAIALVTRWLGRTLVSVIAGRRHDLPRTVEAATSLRSTSFHPPAPSLFEPPRRGPPQLLPAR